jgi:hypothetical protein
MLGWKGFAVIVWEGVVAVFLTMMFREEVVF